MGRRPIRVPLHVFLNGRLVGTLRKEPSGAIAFSYHEDWLAWEHAIPVSLSLPLDSVKYTGDRVHTVFDNMLPDNDDIRRHVAARTGAAGADAFSLLHAIGRDCVGALQFLPVEDAPGPAGVVDGRAVSAREIGALLRDLKSAPLGINPASDFRISIAGAQEKTALLYHGGRWMLPSGTSATTHIIKPAIDRLANGAAFPHSVENEHLCMRFLEALGLPVAKTEMVDFDGVRALVVERFDRYWARDGRLLRVPQEDCCQALSVPCIRKYESEGGPGTKAILHLLRASDAPMEDHGTFMAAQLAFWLLGATDGHAKNFSIRLGTGGRFRLTPLYDVLSAQPLVDKARLRRNSFRIAMAMGKGRHYRMDEIHPRHFVECWRAASLSEAEGRRVVEDIAAKVAPALEALREKLPAGVPESLVDSICGGVARRAEKLSTLA
jgi:serine/threonine-protein kinase HipA